MDIYTIILRNWYTLKSHVKVLGLYTCTCTFMRCLGWAYKRQGREGDIQLERQDKMYLRNELKLTYSVPLHLELLTV